MLVTGTTLLDFRKNLVHTTGLTNLVVDTTTYADAGANAIINLAVRSLARRLNHSTDSARHRVSTDLAANDYVKLFDGLRGLHSVWVSNADGRSDLVVRSIEKMRALYSTPISDIDTGLPTDVALIQVPLSDHMRKANVKSDSEVVSTTELVTDFDFDDPTKWTLSGGATISASTLYVGSSPTAPQATQSVSLTRYKYYRVVVTTDNTTTGSVTVSLGNTQGDPITIQGVTTQDLRYMYGAATLTLSMTTDFDGTVLSISVKELSPKYSTVQTWDWEDVVFDQSNETDLGLRTAGVLFLPPADEAYTLTVYGTFDNLSLSADTDTNLYLTRFPDLVLWKACYFAAVMHGASDALIRMYQNTFENELEQALRLELYDMAAQRMPKGPNGTFVLEG